MATHKPGTLAIATVRGVEGVRVFRDEEDWHSGRVVAGCLFHGDAHVTDIRPLLVLNLDEVCSGGASESGGAAVAWCIENHTGNECALINRVAAQIREQTTPPKPPRIDEPGLWGVVSASFNGRTVTQWVRYEARSGACWRNPFGDTRAWSELIDPTLVRDGIES